MKVLSVLKKGIIQVKDMPKPKCIPGYALIKMKACGVCGSDITAYKGVNPTVKYPIDGIGHEGVGIVEEISRNDKSINVGDMVALEPYVPCYECHMCREKRYNNCVDIRVCGVHKNGMMAEYFLHPVSLLHKIPNNMDLIKSTMIEPLSIALHAVTRAKVSKGYCLIFGAGTIGLLTAFASINYGAKPILVDVIQNRLNTAKTLGIKNTFNPKDGDIMEYISNKTNGIMPETMIDCSGATTVIENMHNYVGYGAKIALVGWPKQPVEINTVRCMQKELDIYTSRNSNMKFPEAIKLIEDDKIPVSEFITTVKSFNEAESIIDKMSMKPEEFLKVVIKI